MSKVPKILYIARDDGGCGFYRCRQPASFLKRAGVAETLVVQTTATEEQLLWADLVIMQEMGSVNGSNIARFLIEHKIPYLTEVDDYLHHVSPHNVSGYGAWNPSTLYLHRAMEMIRAGFGMTVSTNQLAREYFPYQPLIYVVPNYLDKDKWDQPIVRRRDGKIRIGWAGGNAHADDLYTVSAVLQRIVQESKGTVIFETMGMTKNELGGVFKLKELHEECPSCQYEGEIHHYPGESLDNYPSIIASKGWDIAIAPVIANAFGHAKSDIKIKEMAAIGLPVVASPVTPYKEAAANGAQILFAETFEEWYTTLTKLVKDAELREKMGFDNRKWSEKNWIQDNYKHISEVYSQVLMQAEKVLGPKEARK